MKKYKILMLGLLAVFAFSAVLAATASAESTLLAEWLLNGAAAPVDTATLTTAGTIKLGDTTFKAVVECTGRFEGTVNEKENNGEDSTTKVLNAAGVERTLTAPFTVAGGECKNVSGCETAHATEVAPEVLPWQTLLVLDSVTGLFLDYVVKATYAVTCTIVGLKTTDECKVEGGKFEVLSAAEGAEAKGAVEPLGNCSIGGKEKGEEEFIGANHLQTLTGEAILPSSVA
jgi:hypothetical protein